MSDWLISVPVWGKTYVETFVQKAAPSIRAALIGFEHNVRFVIHTDSPEIVHKALSGFVVETVHVGSGPTYVTLQKSHGDAINRAAIGERVVLLNADLIMSDNLLRSCQEHFDKGSSAIVLVGIRTIMGEDIPIGVDSRTLLSWAWEYRHQIVRDLEWYTGTSMLPTNLFFVKNDVVVMHGFHLHPVAIVKSQEISFRSTIDGDLLDHYSRDSIHVVTDPDDMAIAEISPSSKRFPVRPERLNPDNVASAMITRASPLHRWLFNHKITICGDGNSVDTEPMVQDILSCLDGKLVRAERIKQRRMGPRAQIHAMKRRGR